MEYNPSHPNQFPTKTRLEEETLESQESNEDPNEKLLNQNDPDDNLEDKIMQSNQTINDTILAERLIYKRKNQYNQPGGDTLESVGVTMESPGLLPVAPIMSFDNRILSIHSGILYRIQGIQTLIIANVSDRAEWNDTKEGKKTGYVPRIAEYMFASFYNERDGMNPYITAEEDSTRWKNHEYTKNKTKGALWMFVPTEKEKFFEIRNRNYPASLLVWGYDKDEGEFVLYLETRRTYLKRYMKDGSLRHRSIFALHRVTEYYNWEIVRDKRPKYYIYTYNQNHVYLYESTKRGCTMLIVRNSAEQPYMPDKTDMMGRPLDMFYITRIDLTGNYTASIFSFSYEKSIVDVFALSQEQKGSIKNLRTFQIANRGPVPVTQYVFEDIVGKNDIRFEFFDTFRAFQWVTLEAHLPSFGIAPIVMSGVLGRNTDTNVISREFTKEYEIQDKIVLESGSWINASVIFQRIDNLENPFNAIMEVTEPADRLYFDKQGKPRFIRLSLPAKMIENTWHTKANFTYDRVIERREAALVVQVKGKLIGSYGLRAFVKKNQRDYSAGIISCGDEDHNKPGS